LPVPKLPKRYLIAIVDDDTHVRDGLEDLVRSMGYPAIAFASVEEYLRSGILYSSLCVICDFHLPGMSGADLQDFLLDGGHRIPMIFVSTVDDAGSRDRVMRKGALGILQAPFEEQRLIEYLEQAIKEAR
jgi:FixJ family two-component response regulator